MVAETTGPAHEACNWLTITHRRPPYPTPCCTCVVIIVEIGTPLRVTNCQPLQSPYGIVGISNPPIRVRCHQ
jgi:hypothetical protein